VVVRRQRVKRRDGGFEFCSDKGCLLVCFPPCARCTWQAVSNVHVSQFTKFVSESEAAAVLNVCQLLKRHFFMFTPCKLMFILYQHMHKKVVQIFNINLHYLFVHMLVYKKVKQSHYRPGQAQRVPVS
jgi:hypothetical protein